jgi:hypothetical protein
LNEYASLLSAKIQIKLQQQLFSSERDLMMLTKFRAFTSFLFSLILIGLSARGIADTNRGLGGQPIIGRVEKVYVEDGDITLVGRIDTGAGVASINAEIIKTEKGTSQNSPEKITFQIQDSEKRTKTLTRKVVEWQSIKRKGNIGYIKRPVIEMDFCIAGKRIEARVNLAKRDRFLYPLLVGRNVLKAGDFLIDPAKKFLGKPKCPTLLKK